jgi:FkbM family methyltransferase
MLGLLKNIAVRILESHPIGYALGAELITRLDFLLPHEEDYWGFRRLAAGRPEGLFLDLGANLGHSARGFLKVVPGWTIFSVEANPAHRPRLEKVKRKIPRYDFRIAAIDSESGRSLTFFVPYYRGWLSMHSAAATTLDQARQGIAKAFPRQEKCISYLETRVETITIDDLGLAPGIIKIDIEGKEFSGLQGAQKVIEHYSPDLLIEVPLELKSNEDQEPAMPSSREPTPIIDYLKTLGYAPYAYEKATDDFIRFEGTIKAGARNLFFSRRALEEKVAKATY